jgi:hypothetical protein
MATPVQVQVESRQGRALEGPGEGGPAHEGVDVRGEVHEAEAGRAVVGLDLIFAEHDSSRTTVSAAPSTTFRARATAPARARSSLGPLADLVQRTSPRPR